MKTKGFTLIELLVVIAVIAVLMGILMPSLRMAREQARSLVCASNMKTLVLGWRLYAESNNDKLVDGLTPTDPTPPNSSWVWMPPSPDSASIEDKIAYIKKGALWRYINNEKVYHCPSDGRMSGRGSAAAQLAYRTYSIAGGLNGQTGQDVDKVCLTLTDIKNPGRKFAFVPECDIRGYNRGSWLMDPMTGRWVDAIGVWHRGRSTNFGFVDGHVDKRAWKSQKLVDWFFLALDDPTKFGFYRVPTDGGAEEIDDWCWTLSRYPYKSLKAPGIPRTYGGFLD